MALSPYGVWSEPATADLNTSGIDGRLRQRPRQHGADHALHRRPSRTASARTACSPTRRARRPPASVTSSLTRATGATHSAGLGHSSRRRHRRLAELARQLPAVQPATLDAYLWVKTRAVRRPVRRRGGVRSWDDAAAPRRSRAGRAAQRGLPTFDRRSQTTGLTDGRRRCRHLHRRPRERRPCSPDIPSDQPRGGCATRYSNGARAGTDIATGRLRPAAPAWRYGRTPAVERRSHDAGSPAPRGIGPATPASSAVARRRGRWTAGSCAGSCAQSTWVGAALAACAGATRRAVAGELAAVRRQST